MIRLHFTDGLTEIHAREALSYSVFINLVEFVGYKKMQMNCNIQTNSVKAASTLIVLLD